MSDIFSSDAAPWFGLIAAVLVLLALDLWVMRGRDGVMTTGFAAKASVFWVAISLAFAGLLFLLGDSESAANFLAGYAVEKSLSLDNVFVFWLVLNAFAVPDDERHRLLTYGIVGALVLRGVFIVVGATALEAFQPVEYLFAALLIWTGWKLWRERHEHGSEEKMVEGLVQRLPMAEDPPPQRFFVRRGRKVLLTSGGAALVAVALVDVLFAIDSVPAILAITSDAFIVFAANAFALLGLRPLFFLVADLVERLYYLKAALAVLLIVIGLKLGLAELVGKIGPEITLSVIALVLGTGVVASLIRSRRRGGGKIAAA